jgi:tripeptide aminopeptidase
MALSPLSTRLLQTLLGLLGLPSTSGHEEQIRAYLVAQLTHLGLAFQIDASGNLIATLPGEGQPVLLNAHMDRVPPGLAHQPTLRDGVLYSDGTTNLGADDAAGLALILEIVRSLVEEKLPHPPLIIVFTVQEEVGLLGASAFDPTPWQVNEGIVFDNAFEAGIVVSQGASYVAFNIEITGRTGHPGKDLTQTVNALEILRTARYPHGSLNNDQTRILLGHVTAGSTRNAVPAHVHIEGELRSFEPADARQSYLQAIQQAFEDAAQRLGGRVEISYEPHCTSYLVDENEPLLALYRDVLAERGERLRLRPTFIGSDASALRPRVKAFTISTGVAREHSSEEYVPLEPLAVVVQDILALLRLRCSS